MRSLTIFMPGLLGPDMAIHPDDLPDLPALNWILTKGGHQSQTTVSASYSLCELFGISVAADNDFPVAAISRLTDDNQYPDGFWLRADPVHVQADRDGLILIDNNQFTISQHDALVLSADIHSLLDAHDLALEVPVPTRWYLRIKEDLKIKTTPIDAVTGQTVLPFMPDGDDRLNLRQLMNDIQMTLHNAELNKQRVQEHKLPINSLWFWGYGALPKRVERQWSFVCSDEILAKSLSMIAVTPFTALPDNYLALDKKDVSYKGLIVINACQKYSYYHDLEGWLEALLFYEANWFQPLITALKRNELDQLHIKTDMNYIRLDQSSRYKFWKKKQNIHACKH